MMLWRVTRKANTMMGVMLRMAPIETRWHYKHRWAAHLRARFETLSPLLGPMIMLTIVDVTVEPYFPGENIIQFKRVA